MSEGVNSIYDKIVLEYDKRNDETHENLNYVEFDTIVTNRLFTPKHTVNSAGSAEDLQIRVSKDIAFYVGENENAINQNFSLQITDDVNQLESRTLINTAKDNLKLTANYIELNDLTINNNAGALKISTDKVLQIHSGNKIEMLGKVEFSNEVKFEKNVYVGNSIIFFNEQDAASQNNQIRIGLQYNQQRDTLDIVKQSGNGANIKKRLMARLGQGNIQGNDSSLLNVPYNTTTDATNNNFSTDASTYNAFNIWKQNNQVLYYGTESTQKVGIGLSNMTEKFAVLGTTKINNIMIDMDAKISGVVEISSTNVLTTNQTTSGNMNILGNTNTASLNVTNLIETNAIKFRNSSVTSFDGKLSSLSNDLAPWLQSSQNSVNLSAFNNDANFIKKLNEVPIDSRWRFKESGATLLLQKYNISTSTWIDNQIFS
jgi:hypothetical protein